MAALASAADAQLQKELTEDEVADYKEAFDNFDKDKSGEIDENELATVLRSLGYAPTDKQLKDMMARVDLDGNGKRPLQS
jgi:calmodulin